MKLMFGLLLGVLLLGAVDSCAENKIPIEGTLNLADQTCVIKVGPHPDQPFFLELARIKEGNYDLQLTVTHWKRELFDLSTVLNGSLKILPAKDGTGQDIKVRLFSKYTLLKNRPFDDISADIAIRNNQLSIHSLSLGQISLSGAAVLGPVIKLDFMVKISDLPLKYAAAFYTEAESIPMEGNVDGEIRVHGPIDRLQISGRAVSYNGAVGLHAYHMAQFKFNGIYPIVNINEDSRIDQKEGFSFKVKGALDLSDLKSFPIQVKNFSCRPLISGGKDDLEWTLKRLQAEEKGSTEFKYMRRTGGSGMEEDDGLLGVQRRVEF
ncbi:MAG: hypothetical protein AB1650_00830 [Candidatus Omnitrophota bacterium]